MPEFNPDFWEIPVAPEYFDQLTTEDYLWYRAPDDEYTIARHFKRQAVLKQIHQIIAKYLTTAKPSVSNSTSIKAKPRKKLGTSSESLAVL